MTTEELAELFLVSLNDVAEAAPHPYFLFSMNQFAPQLGVSDMAELRRALGLLEERGFIYCASTDAWGGISAGITPEGSVFVEQGGKTGIIERFRKDPSSVVIKTEPPQPLPYNPEPTVSRPASEEPSAPAPGEGMLEAILAEMVSAVEGESALEPSARGDLLSDIETLKIQLAKRKKDTAIITAVLSNLSQVPAVAPLVRLLFRLAE